MAGTAGRWDKGSCRRYQGDIRARGPVSVTMPGPFVFW